MGAIRLDRFPLEQGQLRGRRQKLYARIVGGRSDANVPFEGVRALLLSWGFAERIEGSHHNFRRGEVLFVLQQERGGKCKPYQVRQMRMILPGCCSSREIAA